MRKRIIIFIISPLIYTEIVNIIAGLLNSSLYSGNLLPDLAHFKDLILEIVQLNIFTSMVSNEILVIIISSLLFGLLIAPITSTISDVAGFISKSGIYFSFIAITLKITQDINAWNALDRFTRNIIMIQEIIASLVIFNISILTAIIIIKLKESRELHRENQQYSEIITRCECGAVYRSNPEICVVCGRKLEYNTSKKL